MQAARDHAEASSAAGIAVIQGVDGSSGPHWPLYGVGGRISENLYYGRDDSEEIVVQLLTDRGVTGRGHRRNILNAKMAAAGVAVRRHPRCGSICVMDFASLLRPLQQRRRPRDGPDAANCGALNFQLADAAFTTFLPTWFTRSCTAWRAPAS